ncbi:uncharacterized protein RCO7_09008 [Rhynchosporium graminicola]|uniref:Extracellular membrane protein CFEM domain-containing protein n=1 Tax=Rhynchosporium graminicola TaxID=2792576 RepID=A0A1E1JUM4_9HELO|nr:uncharacterized protein RCO7_09008 [Rhynchosporium commune]
MRSSGLIALMTFGLGAFAGKAPLGAAGDRCQNRPDCISGICNPDPTSGTGKNECDTYTSTSCKGVGNKLKLHCVAKKRATLLVSVALKKEEEKGPKHRGRGSSLHQSVGPWGCTVKSKHERILSLP